jgi:hypothetical protein
MHGLFIILFFTHVFGYEEILENIQKDDNSFFNHKILIFAAIIILTLFMGFVFHEHTYNKNKGTISFRKVFKRYNN